MSLYSFLGKEEHKRKNNKNTCGLCNNSLSKHEALIPLPTCSECKQILNEQIEVQISYRCIE